MTGFCTLHQITLQLFKWDKYMVYRTRNRKQEENDWERR